MTKNIEVRFVSRNFHKIEEAKKILAEESISVIECNETIEELQTSDTIGLRSRQGIEGLSKNWATAVC